jgi:hypothetical protein
MKGLIMKVLQNGIDKTEINSKIFQIIKEKGGFEWTDFTDEEAWQAFLYSDNLVFVVWNFDSEDETIKDRIIDFIVSSEGKSKEVILEVNTNLKVITAKIEKKETFIGLRNMTEGQVVESGYGQCYRCF